MHAAGFRLHRSDPIRRYTVYPSMLSQKGPRATRHPVRRDVCSRRGGLIRRVGRVAAAQRLADVAQGRRHDDVRGEPDQQPGRGPRSRRRSKSRNAPPGRRTRAIFVEDGDWGRPSDAATGCSPPGPGKHRERAARRRRRCGSRSDAPRRPAAALAIAWVSMASDKSTPVTWSPGARRASSMAR